MSWSDASPLAIEVQGGPGVAENLRQLALLTLSGGLRRSGEARSAIADGTPPVAARIRYQDMAKYLPGIAPVQALVELNVNLADVVSLKIYRTRIGQLAFLHKQGCLHIFPRTDESDDPLSFTWLGTSVYLFFNTIARFSRQIQEWFYVRYGGPQPSTSADTQSNNRLSRSIHGSIEIEIQTDESLKVVALLGSGDLYIANVMAELPKTNVMGRRSPTEFAELRLLKTYKKVEFPSVRLCESVPLGKSGIPVLSRKVFTRSIPVLNRKSDKLKKSPHLTRGDRLFRIKRLSVHPRLRLQFHAWLLGRQL